MTVSLDAEVAQRIRRHAAREGKDVSSWINELAGRHTELADLREVAEELRAAGVDSPQRWQRRARLVAEARAEFARLPQGEPGER
jgi:hypothetical protein